MDPFTFFIAVFTGVVAAGIVKLLSITISYPANFPLIKGERWIGTYKDKEGTEITEEIVIDQQLFSKFRGRFVSSVSPPHSQKKFSYKFKGKFINPNFISVEFRPTNRSFSDYGIAIYELDKQHNSIVGHAVSFSRHTNNVFPHSYKGTRLR